jgi:hypothetical protein
LSFVPRYLSLAAAHLFGLVALAALVRRGWLGARVLTPLLLGMTLLDLFGFGFGLNPAIAAAADRPESPLIGYLRREVGPTGRILGLGEELPPNTLMRYGLADPRNYDSIELATSLDWFAPLYERAATGESPPCAEAATSRRAITWEGVLRARQRLQEAAVRAVVAGTPPPAGAFARVDRVGAVWVAHLGAAPLASAPYRRGPLELTRQPGVITVRMDCACADRIVVRETFDPSWRGKLDGVDVPVAPENGAFLAVEAPAGRHELVLRYDPPEVRLALAVSVSALLAAVFALTDFRPFRSTRIMVLGLGRTQAAELESDLRSSPELPPANH